MITNSFKWRKPELVVLLLITILFLHRESIVISVLSLFPKRNTHPYHHVRSIHLIRRQKHENSFISSLSKILHSEQLLKDNRILLQLEQRNNFVSGNETSRSIYQTQEIPPTSMPSAISHTRQLEDENTTIIPPMSSSTPSTAYPSTSGKSMSSISPTPSVAPIESSYQPSYQPSGIGNVPPMASPLKSVIVTPMNESPLASLTNSPTKKAKVVTKIPTKNPVRTFTPTNMKPIIGNNPTPQATSTQTPVRPNPIRPFMPTSRPIVADSSPTSRPIKKDSSPTVVPTNRQAKTTLDSSPTSKPVTADSSPITIPAPRQAEPTSRPVTLDSSPTSSPVITASSPMAAPTPINATPSPTPSISNEFAPSPIASSPNQINPTPVPASQPMSSQSMPSPQPVSAIEEGDDFTNDDLDDNSNNDIVQPSTAPTSITSLQPQKLSDSEPTSSMTPVFTQPTLQIPAAGPAIKPEIPTKQQLEATNSLSNVPAHNSDSSIFSTTKSPNPTKVSNISLQPSRLREPTNSDQSISELPTLDDATDSVSQGNLMTDTSNSSSSIQPGAIIGIVIGLLLINAVAIYYVMKLRRQKDLLHETNDMKMGRFIVDDASDTTSKSPSSPDLIVHQLKNSRSTETMILMI